MARFNLIKPSESAEMLAPKNVINFWQVEDFEGNSVLLSAVIKRIVVNENKKIVTIFIEDGDFIVAPLDLLQLSIYS